MDTEEKLKTFLNDIQTLAAQTRAAEIEVKEYEMTNKTFAPIPMTLKPVNKMGELYKRVFNYFFKEE